jgi:RNA polymerase sigma-70 factor, ECF subfamily
MASRIDELCDAAAAAWPDVTIDRAELAAAIEARLAGAEPPAATPELAAELLLALGCARGDVAALAHFEARYLDVVAPALAHLKLPAATVEDVRAVVRDKLILADGDRPPRLLAYAGQGRLRGLVQVSAVRAALDRLRRDARELPVGGDDLAGRLPAAGAGPELEMIKAQYRAAFAEAFAAAASELDRRDRNLLRLHFLGGVTLEQLAAMYGVHRATVVRWLAAARRAVFDGTRQRMRDHLSDTELDEVLALVESRLEVSVPRLLASLDMSSTP